MPQIVQQGSLNTTALVVPDLYVQIVPPQNLLINGVPTNVVGVVGTAQWGPVGQPMIVGSMAQYASTFGALQNRANDMGTAVAVAALQGASNFRCVRVTDGTDAAATAVILTNCITFTAAYTGTLGNAITITTGPGSRVGTSRAVVGVPGYTPEVFDLIGAGPSTTTTAAVTSSVTIPLASTVGIVVGQAIYGVGISGSPTVATITSTGITASATQTIASGATLTFGLTGNAMWVAMAAAINSGNSITRGPSNFVTASAGAGTTAVAAASYLMAGGLDGVTSITTAVMIGQDTLPRKGMYALRQQGCNVALLADISDSTSWTTQIAYGLSEGTYMITVAPAGSAIQNGTTGTVDLKQAAGADSYALKILHGDWIYWADPVNGVTRLVSPQGFVAGRLGNLSPEQSSLNKPIYGIVGSQKSGLVASQNTAYASADLQTLIQNGIDVVCNPQPAGYIWGCRSGHNCSSNASIQGDNYTRMTNYIASTIGAGMGQFVGKLNTITLQRQVRATLMNFFANLLLAGQLNLNSDGSLPYGVICDGTNNPQSSTGLGYLIANCQVAYTPVVEKFITNLEGGQTVVVLKQSTTPTSTPAQPSF